MLKIDNQTKRLSKEAHNLNSIDSMVRGPECLSDKGTSWSNCSCTVVFKLCAHAPAVFSRGQLSHLLRSDGLHFAVHYE